MSYSVPTGKIIHASSVKQNSCFLNGGVAAGLFPRLHDLLDKSRSVATLHSQTLHKGMDALRRACHKPLLDVVGSSSLGNQHDKIVAKDDAFEFRVNFAVFRKAGTQRPEIVNRP